jgi:biopolymer transport protein ExbD
MSATAESVAWDDEPLVPPRPPAEDAHFDITPMVDLVFMMNIFFLVTWVTATLAEVDLPAARHCTAADPETSVIFTVVAGENRKATVYLGDLRESKQVDDNAQFEERIRQAVEEGKGHGKNTVLVKAEKNVVLREIVRLSSAAMVIEGMNLKLAVLEKE